MIQEIRSRFFQIQRFRLHQALVFLLTAFLYTTFHAARTTWAYSQKDIENDTYFNDHILSVLDTAFMLSYAGGLFYNGWLGDQSHLKTFLVRGGLFSVFALYAFAILCQCDVHNLVLFCLLFSLFGYGQSKGFPGSMAVLGNWMETSHRGLLIGLWNISVNLGNVIGQQIGKHMIDINKLPWFTSIYICGGLILLITTLVSLFLKVHPREAGFEPTRAFSENSPAVGNNDSRNEGSQEDKKEGELPVVVKNQESASGMSFLQAWKTPKLIKYALTYACVKGATYGMLFWLPNYLQTVIGYGHETANVTALYEVGQFCGAILLGYWSDKRGKRSLVLVVGLYISAFIFMCIATLSRGTSPILFAVLLYFAGFFFGGTEVIIGGVISSDLGDQESLKNNSKTISTITGIIDGCGSIGAALVQLIIPYVKSQSFVLYFSLCLCAAVMTTHLAGKEAKTSKNIKEDQQIMVASHNIELKATY